MSVHKLSKSEEKRIEARNQIMRASLKLFYTKGYEDTTTRDIIREAGILNGSLYNRFRSKDSILSSIVSDALADVLEGSEKLFARAFSTVGHSPKSDESSSRSISE